MPLHGQMLTVILNHITAPCLLPPRGRLCFLRPSPITQWKLISNNGILVRTLTETPCNLVCYPSQEVINPACSTEFSSAQAEMSRQALVLPGWPLMMSPLPLLATRMDSSFTVPLHHWFLTSQGLTTPTPRAFSQAAKESGNMCLAFSGSMWGDGLCHQGS